MKETGGRSASLHHIMGEAALAVGMPTVAAPPGWKWVALTDIARLESGHTPSRKHPEYWGGEIPWLSIRDAKAHHAGTIHDTIEHTNELGIANSSARILPAGTVCLSRTASVGYVVITGRPMATSQDFVNWVCSKLLEPRFLQYLLIFEGPSLSRFSSGAVHQTIYFPEVKAFHICLPPLQEQQRIVAALDEAFAAIAAGIVNAEKNLANARELFELERDAIVSGSGPEWIETPLGEICRTQYGISGSMNAVGKGYKIFRMGEVQDGQMVDTGAMKYIDIPEQEFEPYRLRKGDVLFNRTNSIALVGKTGMFSLDGPYCFASYLIRVNFHPSRMSSRFACHVMNSRSFLDRVRAKAAQSVNQANINATVLRSERVRYPKSLAMQEALADKLDGLRQASDDLADQYEWKLTQLAALKQSLLRRAFAGELTRHKSTAAVSANDNFTTPEFSAQILAFAHFRHVALGRTGNFGHVKAQKTLHAVEAIGGLDLGRRPIRDAAGPNDFAHMRLAEDWARQQSFFEFVQRTTGGYDFRQLANYDTLLDKAKQGLEQAGATAKRAVELLVDMDSDFAEIVVTTHAAWNNLILDQATITDDAIVHAARDDWHRDKLRYDKSRFHDAIRFIRSNDIEPDGSAKRVGGQESLPL